MANKVRVEIVADGQRRVWSGEGPGPALVAAFRVWLSSDQCAFPMAAGADDVDVRAAQPHLVADTPPPPPVIRKGREETQLEPVWSGSLEREGRAPGLSGAGALSKGNPS